MDYLGGMMSLKKVLASAAVLAASGSIVAVAPAAQATDYPECLELPC